MASVMAIVSRAVFESQHRGATAVAGTLLDFSEYLSTNKALSPLREGGSLFLVTVRPGDRLWLVAILESPSLKQDRWVAEPSTIPVADITTLIPQLRFRTGTGLKPKPGALGMALQTPRALTPDDEALLRSAANSLSAADAYRAAVQAMRDEEPVPVRASRKKRATAAQSPAPVQAGSGWAQALVSHAVWQSLDDGARRSALEELAALVGPGYAVASTGTGRQLGRLVHEASGVQCVAVPGGAFLMGFTVDDVRAIWGVMTPDEEESAGWSWPPDIARARPPHPVLVPPFLATVHYVSPDQEASLGGAWRLIGEAEWEWLAREGGAVRFCNVPPESHPLQPATAERAPTSGGNGWGVEGLIEELQLVADGWHDSYDGAPTTTDPWEPGNGPGVERVGHIYWQSSLERIALHAAYRAPVRDAFCRRLVRSIPGARAQGPMPDLASSMSETLAGLRLKGQQPELSCKALSALVRSGSWAPEAPLAIRSLLPAMGGLPPATRAAVLRVFGDVAAADHRRLWSTGLDLAVPEIAAACGAPMASETLAAIGEATDSMVQSLRDKDGGVRSAAAFALAFCPSVAVHVRPELERALAAERKPEAKASLVLALAHMDRMTGAGPSAMKTLLGNKNEIVAAAAAIGLALASGSPTPASAIEPLARALAVPRTSTRLLPWHGGDLSGWAYQFVQQLPDARIEAARALASIRPAAALRILLPESEAILEPSALGPQEREILVTISQRHLPQSEDVTPYGVPWLLEDRRRLLGLDPPGAADRETEGKPFWRWYRERLAAARKAGCTREQWREGIQAVIGTWSPVERLALVLEAHRHWMDSGYNEETVRIDGLAALIPLEKAVTEAAAADREGALRAASDALSRAIDLAGRGVERSPATWRAVKACALLLGPGQELDPRCDALLAMEIWPPAPEMIKALGFGRAEAIVMAQLRPTLQDASRSTSWFTRGAQTAKFLLPVLDNVPSPRIALALYLLALISGVGHEELDGVRKVAAGNPSIAAAIEPLLGADAGKLARPMLAELAQG